MMSSEGSTLVASQRRDRRTMDDVFSVDSGLAQQKSRIGYSLAVLTSRKSKDIVIFLYDLMRSLGIWWMM
ncbi:hypothetical protein AHAS_Ahas09G0030700 [Arachis hypogaea]